MERISARQRWGCSWVPLTTAISYWRNTSFLVGDEFWGDTEGEVHVLCEFYYTWGTCAGDPLALSGSQRSPAQLSPGGKQIFLHTHFPISQVWLSFCKQTEELHRFVLNSLIDRSLNIKQHLRMHTAYVTWRRITILHNRKQRGAINTPIFVTYSLFCFL